MLSERHFPLGRIAQTNFPAEYVSMISAKLNKRFVGRVDRRKAELISFK